MAIKFAVVVLLGMVLSVYAQGHHRATLCKKQEDQICESRAEDSSRWCKYKRVRYQCPRLCGVCAPFTGVCPSEYRFGCCWNGDESLTIDKTDCPMCEDVNERICARHKHECDFQSNSEITRRFCPRTCNACSDYGNEKINE